LKEPRIMLTLYWKEFRRHVYLCKLFYCTPYEIHRNDDNTMKVQLISSKRYRLVYKLISYYLNIQLVMIWTSHFIAMTNKEEIKTQFFSAGVVAIYTTMYFVSLPNRIESISEHIPDFINARIKLERLKNRGTFLIVFKLTKDKINVLKCSKLFRDP